MCLLASTDLHANTTTTEEKKLKRSLLSAKYKISRFIPEVCDALTTVLKEYLQVLSTLEKWQRIQRRFEHRWNFPNVIGALDGKHVNIILPMNSRSDYYNYKEKSLFRWWNFSEF
ncbi:uncharacterized protein LOC117601685 isoform X2 [Osmia lignaria lignaria]|uniref:uncharacterized protein LOC117601685 isoform X2 n=1 Tax=Osmia lignaria lignaria TaxID=1437193 RepID=UPI00402B651C